MNVNRPDLYTIAVFPFLKTSAPFSLGGLQFRCTTDTKGLPEHHRIDVNAVSEMLYVSDHYRVERATYTIVHGVHLLKGSSDLFRPVRDIQAVVAYTYASPRHEFGDLFLSSCHASLVMFSPARLSAVFVRQTHNVVATTPRNDLPAKEGEDIDGYVGLYNFKHVFHVASESRVYGPRPTMVLNISQDLVSDLERSAGARPDYALLQQQLNRRDSAPHARLMTAVECFNAANDDANEEPAAIVYLAVAFETLLQVPSDQKSDRLIDAISMLLGRLPRLDIWARQFYDARSSILHEGNATQLRFVPMERPTQDAPTYQSLLSYGRQIFQLCLGAMLVGLDLAERANLAEKLVTNQERLQRICEVLSDTRSDPETALLSIRPIVHAASEYRYVQEPKLKIEAMLGATKGCAKTLLRGAFRIPPDLRQSLEDLAAAERTPDHMNELSALKAVAGTLPKETRAASDAEQAAFALLDLIWGYVSLHYLWRLQESVSGQATPKQLAK